MRAALPDLPMVVLASSSPRRLELLKELGVDFRVTSGNVPELHTEELTAPELSKVNAYRKARSAAKKYPDSLVLGADTLVYAGTALYGKPKDFGDAYRMLDELQGRTHAVVTSVCLLHLREHKQRVFSEVTDVTFKRLDAVAIQKYLVAVDPMDKAGAYAIQEKGDWIVERVAGSFSNVVGLPTERLYEEFRNWSAPPAVPRGSSARR